MRRSTLLRPAFFVLLAITLSSGTAIKYIPAGTPAGGTYSLPSIGGGPIDAINLGNLNVYIKIPLIQKPGRGAAYNYSLAYDTTVWHTAYVSGVNTWQPALRYGWDFSTPTYHYFNGYLSSQIVQSWTQPCDPSHNNFNPVYVEVYSFFVFHDANGSTHPFNLSTSNYGGGVRP